MTARILALGGVLIACLNLSVVLQAQPVGVRPPGLAYAPMPHVSGEGAPRIFNYSPDAGPDESFVIIGEGLTSELEGWGASPDQPEGHALKLRVQSSSDSMLIATLPEKAYDGPIVVWAKNAKGFSDPIVLNAPQLWWCAPATVEAGATLRVFGRNLGRRPGYTRAFACLTQAGGATLWLSCDVIEKYQLRLAIPKDLRAGTYQLWVHAGNGGDYGWSDPLTVVVRPPMTTAERFVSFDGSGDLQAFVNQLAEHGGGVVKLPAGVIPLRSTLIVPTQVTLQGMGRGRTILQSPADPADSLPPVVSDGWNSGPAAVHNAGDQITYRTQFPAAGNWTVWVRYATQMSKYGLAGVSGRTSLTLGGQTPVALENLPNTGSFDTFRWCKSAVLTVPAPGTHDLVWTNAKGGGINLDAYVFAQDPAFVPTDSPWPATGSGLVVQQAEDAVRFHSKEGALPLGDRAALWLAGDGAAIRDLTVSGSRRTNLGVIVRSRQYPKWIDDCTISAVTIADHEGKQAENCGIRLFNASNARVVDNEIWGRAPLFFSGVRQCTFADNRLIATTLWGGGAEAYILGRNDVVRQCIVENNVCARPPGDQGGGPTGRRILWFSVGRGSVDHNWIASNREDRATFGGVAGTDQNVGEMILFEACERIAYHGKLSAADAQSVTIPTMLPATSDDRLGSVKRELLAHDHAGNETPFWPPDADDGGIEPISSEYYVTILQGRGFGQTRRVVARTNATWQLDRPWRVIPQSGATILIHTAFYRNHIVNNRTVDGMTGVQLWIACIENILSGNEVARMRKPGVYLYGNCSTLASSMPRSWNRGIGPLYFNHIEGTDCDQTSAGILLTSGENPKLPVEFPRCLGNVLRHNSAVQSRTDGLVITGNRPAADGGVAAVQGTVAEFNVVRDAQVAYKVTTSTHATLLRRNHVYFWFPVSLIPDRPVAFQIDDEQSATTLEQNEVEGIHGVGASNIVSQQLGPRKTSAK